MTEQDPRPADGAVRESRSVISMAPMHPFHLAFPVHSLAAARAFYGDLLGCPEGRSSEAWVDFDFHGHQIVAHLAPEPGGGAATTLVDGEAVPVRHFDEVGRRTSARLGRQVGDDL